MFKKSHRLHKTSISKSFKIVKEILSVTVLVLALLVFLGAVKPINIFGASAPPTYNKLSTACSGSTCGVLTAAQAISAPYQNIGSDVNINGALYQGGKYAFLGAYNSDHNQPASIAYPRAGNDLAVAWNFTSGGRDVDFWNTDIQNTSGTSFWFTQLTGANTYKSLVAFNANGDVYIGPSGGNARLCINGICELNHTWSTQVSPPGNGGVWTACAGTTDVNLPAGQKFPNQIDSLMIAQWPGTWTNAGASVVTNNSSTQTIRFSSGLGCSGGDPNHNITLIMSGH